MAVFKKGPINTANGWIAAPLNEKAAYDMDVPTHPEDFYRQSMTPEEMDAMELSTISERMLAESGIFLDISETEQPYVEAKDVKSLMKAIEEEMHRSNEPLKKACEKALDVLSFASEHGTGAIFWF